MELLENTKGKKTENENGENVPNLETTEVISVYCNIAKNNCQHDSRVFHTFVPNKYFRQLLDI